jgi:hypothetical protein
VRKRESCGVETVAVTWLFSHRLRFELDTNVETLTPVPSDRGRGAAEDQTLHAQIDEVNSLPAVLRLLTAKRFRVHSDLEASNCLCEARRCCYYKAEFLAAEILRFQPPQVRFVFRPKPKRRSKQPERRNACRRSSGRRCAKTGYDDPMLRRVRQQGTRRLGGELIVHRHGFGAMRIIFPAMASEDRRRIPRLRGSSPCC